MRKHSNEPPSHKFSMKVIKLFIHISLLLCFMRMTSAIRMIKHSAVTVKQVDRIIINTRSKLCANAMPIKPGWISWQLRLSPFHSSRTRLIDRSMNANQLPHPCRWKPEILILLCISTPWKISHHPAPTRHKTLLDNHVCCCSRCQPLLLPASVSQVSLSFWSHSQNS